jgi:molybdate transport system substrate-binding protein
MRGRRCILVALALCALTGQAGAAELKVLTAGAYKAVLVSMKQVFEKSTGHTLVIDNGTAGELVKRIQGGEPFDVVIAPPMNLFAIGNADKLAGRTVELARVGIGVMVPDGSPKPDISTVDAFKAAILAAETVAYVDPASGGSSGIYLTKLFENLGIADAIKSKLRLKNGGLVAELLINGQATLGLQQISEISGVKGVTLVGPLPREIQSFTTYSGAVGAGARDGAAAAALLTALRGEDTLKVLKDKGMEPAVVEAGKF